MSTASRPDTRLGGDWITEGPFSIRSEHDPDELWIVELYGELDGGGTGTLEETLRHAEASNVDEIIVDLSGLRRITSEGLQVLREAHSRCPDGSKHVLFLRGNGQVGRPAPLHAELDSILPFAD